jgi:DNA-binding NarL/FixJ family response regulator
MTVLLVADDACWLSQIRSRLRARRKWQVVSEVSDGLQAVQMAQELSPDVIVIDAGLSGLSGVETARRIRKLLPESEVLLLGQEFDAEVVQRNSACRNFGLFRESKQGG